MYEDHFVTATILKDVDVEVSAEIYIVRVGHLEQWLPIELLDASKRGDRAGCLIVDV